MIEYDWVVMQMTKINAHALSICSGIMHEPTETAIAMGETERAKGITF